MGRLLRAAFCFLAVCALQGCTTMFVWYIPEVRVEPVELISALSEAELNAEGEPRGSVITWIRYSNGDEIAMRFQLSDGSHRAWPLDGPQPEHGPLADADGWVSSPPLQIALNQRRTALLVRTHSNADPERMRLPRHLAEPPYGWSMAWRIPASLISVPIDVATFPIQGIVHLAHTGGGTHTHADGTTHTHGDGSTHSH